MRTFKSSAPMAIFMVVVVQALCACGGGSSSGGQLPGPSLPADTGAVISGPRLNPDSVTPGNAVSVPVTTTPPSEPSSGPLSPGETPPLSPTAGAVQLRGSVVARPNVSYDVISNGSDEVEVSLKMPYRTFGNEIVPKMGDSIRVSGIGTAPWRISTGWEYGITARAPPTPIFIDTRQLSGNAPAGQLWTARLDPMAWHSVAADKTGRVLVAASNPGRLYVSNDAGQSWDALNSPVQNWTSVTAVNVSRSADPSGFQSPVLFAAARGGGLFRYDPYGNVATWVPVISGDPSLDLSHQQWESVAMAGGVFLAAVMNGPIYFTTDTFNANGVWKAATLEGSSQPLVHAWRGLAIAKGTAIAVAVSEDGFVFVSTSRGQNFVSRNVNVAGYDVKSSWYRVAISDDGNTIAVAGRFDSSIYISHDQGLTWTQAGAPAGDYTDVSMSGDGSTIAATITGGRNGPGSVQLSRNRGKTFAPMQMPSSDTNWQAVAMSNDANLITVAGGSASSPGRLYTSSGNRTSYGSGSISGAQGSSLELVFDGFIGNTVQWSVIRSGGSFTVR